MIIYLLWKINKIMTANGKKLSELTDKVSDIQGTERIYVSDGSGVPKYIKTNQLAKPSDIPDVSGFITSTQADGKYATLAQVGDINAILDNINGEVI
jgi:hypothetical protein